MRKFTVLFVMFVMVFAVSSVSLAHGCPPEPECPWVEGPLGKIKTKLDVTGKVGEYAAIQVCPTEVGLDWTGKGYQSDSETTKVKIKSNTNIKLDVAFRALSQRVGWDTYRIATTVGLKRTEENNWRASWSATAPTSGQQASFTAGSSSSPLQGVALREYDVRVSGVLGDIHHQAAGNYSTEVVFTVAKAS